MAVYVSSPIIKMARKVFGLYYSHMSIGYIFFLVLSLFASKHCQQHKWQKYNF